MSVFSIFTALIKIKFLFLSVYEFTCVSWHTEDRARLLFLHHLPPFSFGTKFPMFLELCLTAEASCSVRPRKPPVSAPFSPLPVSSTTGFFMWVLRIYLSSESLLSWLSHISNPFVWFLDEYCLILLFHGLRFFLLDLTWTSECIRKKSAFALAIPSWFMNNRYWISQHFTRKRIGGLGKS